MKLSTTIDFSSFMHRLEQRNPGQPEYIQAVYEVLTDEIAVIASKATMPLVHTKAGFAFTHLLTKAS